MDWRRKEQYVCNSESVLGRNDQIFDAHKRSGFFSPFRISVGVLRTHRTEINFVGVSRAECKASIFTNFFLQKSPKS